MISPPTPFCPRGVDAGQTTFQLYVAFACPSIPAVVSLSSEPPQQFVQRLHLTLVCRLSWTSACDSKINTTKFTLIAGFPCPTVEHMNPGTHSTFLWKAKGGLSSLKGLPATFPRAWENGLLQSPMRNSPVPRTGSCKLLLSLLSAKPWSYSFLLGSRESETRETMATAPVPLVHPAHCSPQLPFLLLYTSSRCSLLQSKEPHIPWGHRKCVLAPIRFRSCLLGTWSQWAQGNFGQVSSLIEESCSCGRLSLQFLLQTTP
ncbi:uncharacterized protein LOC115897404 [Rhinopithecus roxellana]|uniref:uncharacterized protein LOC115897404 n=1 Tax=Rhinopithecus roxellana TaxID=61622 RepID=UPI0012378A11|nr:uncharacterized protein LOC115897404 [Rhinopithecus roxellana]